MNNSIQNLENHDFQVPQTSSTQKKSRREMLEEWLEEKRKKKEEESKTKSSKAKFNLNLSGRTPSKTESTIRHSNHRASVINSQAERPPVRRSLVNALTSVDPSTSETVHKHQQSVRTTHKLMAKTPIHMRPTRMVADPTYSMPVAQHSSSSKRHNGRFIQRPASITQDLLSEDPEIPDVLSKEFQMNLQIQMKEAQSRSSPEKCRTAFNKMLKRQPILKQSALYWVTRAQWEGQQRNLTEATKMFELAAKFKAKPSRQLDQGLRSFLVSLNNRNTVYIQNLEKGIDDEIEDFPADETAEVLPSNANFADDDEFVDKDPLEKQQEEIAQQPEEQEQEEQETQAEQGEEQAQSLAEQQAPSEPADEHNGTQEIERLVSEMSLGAVSNPELVAQAQQIVQTLPLEEMKKQIRSCPNTPSLLKTPSAKTPATAVKTPSIVVKTPSTAVKTPSTAVKTPSTAVKTPSIVVKTPSTAVKTPCASQVKFTMQLPTFTASPFGTESRPCSGTTPLSTRSPLSSPSERKQAPKTPSWDLSIPPFGGRVDPSKTPTRTANQNLGQPSGLFSPLRGPNREAAPYTPCRGFTRADWKKLNDTLLPKKEGEEISNVSNPKNNNNNNMTRRKKNENEEMETNSSVVVLDSVRLRGRAAADLGTHAFTPVRRSVRAVKAKDGGIEPLSQTEMMSRLTDENVCYTPNPSLASEKIYNIFSMEKKVNHALTSDHPLRAISLKLAEEKSVAPRQPKKKDTSKTGKTGAIAISAAEPSQPTNSTMENNKNDIKQESSVVPSDSEPDRASNLSPVELQTNLPAVKPQAVRKSSRLATSATQKEMLHERSAFQQTKLVHTVWDQPQEAEPASSKQTKQKPRREMKAKKREKEAKKETEGEKREEEKREEEKREEEKREEEKKECFEMYSQGIEMPQIEEKYRLPQERSRLPVQIPRPQTPEPEEAEEEDVQEEPMLEMNFVLKDDIFGDSSDSDEELRLEDAIPEAQSLLNNPTTSGMEVTHPANQEGHCDPEEAHEPLDAANETLHDDDDEESENNTTKSTRKKRTTRADKSIVGQHFDQAVGRYETLATFKKEAKEFATPVRRSRRLMQRTPSSVQPSLEGHLIPVTPNKYLPIEQMNDTQLINHLKTILLMLKFD